MNNRTNSVSDERTNETISTRNFSTASENMTTNDLLSGNAGNMTSNEFLAEKFRELGNNSVG